MSASGTLPGIYFDNVEGPTSTGLVVANTVPEESSQGAPVATSIQLDLLAAGGGNVDESASQVYVEGVLAFDGGSFEPGFDGPGSSSSVIGVGDLRIVIDPTSEFASEQVVDVRVVSDLQGGGSAVDYSYSFTVEDTIAPILLSVRAVYADRIRIAFSEDMLRSSSSGAADALNPANYEIEFEPASDVEAAVSVSPESVAIVNSTTFDVTTDIELTFGKTYRLTVAEIADDSDNANTVQHGNNSLTFEAWIPPDWPELRRFDLWSMLSDDDRVGDTSGDLERLISALQDLVDLILWNLDGLSELWDIDKAPIEFVDALLADLGNPFNLDLDEAKRRKLADILVAVYKSKGTVDGVVNLARFFTGLEITSVENLAGGGWTLGESELGIDTYLAPAEQAPFYTFIVNVDRELTDDERQILSGLIDYMKPAHTHFRIVEPTAPEFIDHWELGLSELGDNTVLH